MIYSALGHSKVKTWKTKENCKDATCQASIVIGMTWEEPQQLAANRKEWHCGPMRLRYGMNKGLKSNVRHSLMPVCPMANTVVSH